MAGQYQWGKPIVVDLRSMTAPLYARLNAQVSQSIVDSVSGAVAPFYADMARASAEQIKMAMPDLQIEKIIDTGAIARMQKAWIQDAVHTPVSDAVRRLADVAARDLSVLQMDMSLSQDQLAAVLELVDDVDGQAAYNELRESNPELATGIDEQAMISELRDLLGPEGARWFLASMVFMVVLWIRFQIGQVFPGQSTADVGAHLFAGSLEGIGAAGWVKGKADEFVNKRRRSTLPGS